MSSVICHLLSVINLLLAQNSGCQKRLWKVVLGDHDGAERSVGSCGERIGRLSFITVISHLHPFIIWTELTSCKSGPEVWDIIWAQATKQFQGNTEGYAFSYSMQHPSCNKSNTTLWSTASISAFTSWPRVPLNTALQTLIYSPYNSKEAMGKRGISVLYQTLVWSWIRDKAQRHYSRLIRGHRTGINWCQPG